MTDDRAERKTIRGAVIGYGGAFNMGKAHLGWMRDSGILPVAACDVDEARVRVAETDYPGIRAYTTVEELLRDDEVDLITIITPHNTHAPLAVQALAAGKHVITEKPMCLTAGEATEMIETAKRSGVMLSVFHNRRHDGDFLALKEAIVEQNRIGDVFAIQAGGAGYGHPGYWWRSDKAVSGGAAYDWGAHFIDWILNLMPGRKVVNVTAFSHKRVWHDVTNEDYVQIIIRFDDGSNADLTQGSIATVPMDRWRILGTRGGILDDGTVRDGMRLFQMVDGLRMEGQLRNKPTDWGHYYRNIHAHLTEGAPLDVTPESARRVIAILEAADKSAASGKCEPVPFEDGP
ncbi:MAG: Gfo/Idh/MocA family oxidoreductase [Capsulimonadales bacterium]|nr:Gfo/Idh/MocA family oxidoreductase [Capsulimonadales bacterium]